MNIELTPMTIELCRQYYKEFKADPSIYMDMSLYKEFIYSDEWVDAHYNRQIEKKRIYLAAMYENKPVGEVTLKEIDTKKKECTLSIHLQNDKYKGIGIGTEAEKLVMQYAFGKLGMRAVNADVVLKNERSQHVLEKIGFQYVKEDEIFKYYGAEASYEYLYPKEGYELSIDTYHMTQDACAQKINGLLG